MSASSGCGPKKTVLESLTPTSVPDFLRSVSEDTSSVACSPVCFDQRVEPPACGAADEIHVSELLVVSAQTTTFHSLIAFAPRAQSSVQSEQQFVAAYEEDRASVLAQGICAIDSEFSVPPVPATCWVQLFMLITDGCLWLCGLYRIVAPTLLEEARRTQRKSASMQTLSAILDDVGSRLLQTTGEALQCRQNSVQLSVRLHTLHTCM